MLYSSAMTVISETDLDEATARYLTEKFLPSTLISIPQPIVYAMAGIPGAGKSEFTNGAIERGEFPKNAFILDPDRIMQAIPAYQDDLALSGKQTAYRRWEIPARLFAYALSRMAMERRLNIIQDMGAVRREDYDRLMVFKAAGYRLDMTYIYCPVDECLRRVSSRTTRHTAEEMIRERDQSLRILLPEYVKIADNFRVFDNSDTEYPYRPTTLDEVMGKPL
jgi:predicted ABC-type ATPase